MRPLTAPFVLHNLDKIVFERDDFDPWCLGVEYPDYHVTGLSGSIDGGNIEFSLKFGAIPTSFAGAAQK